MLDPDLGEDVPLAHCQKTCMLTTNGLKIGVIGLGEREWFVLLLSTPYANVRLGTINVLPPNIIYKSATQTAMELVPKLREQGADMIVAVTHQREPNDNKLASQIPDGLIDIILGGHDHYYAHSKINSTHILRSGTDFRQLSYIEAWRKPGGWDFSITRREIVRSIPEDPACVTLVDKLTSTLKAKLDKPVGCTAVSLDSRFVNVRQEETNIGNFVCDLMRFYYGTEASIMASGTIRGDQIYPPGTLRLKDILDCFPFEDPVVVIRVTGGALRQALENGVSRLPALEGRFPQVSNISYSYTMKEPPGHRILSVVVGGQPLDDTRLYTITTRGYMGRGKDGYSSLFVRSEGGTAEELVSEESGVLISTILRQYFLSLKIVGKWNRFSPAMASHWGAVHRQLRRSNTIRTPPLHPAAECTPDTGADSAERDSKYFTYQPRHHHRRHHGINQKSKFANPFPSTAVDAEHADHTDTDAMDTESDTECDAPNHHGKSVARAFPLRRRRTYVTQPAVTQEDGDRREALVRMSLARWRRAVGIDAKQVRAVGEEDTRDENGGGGGNERMSPYEVPTWTNAVAPRVEGRIIRVG